MYSYLHVSTGTGSACALVPNVNHGKRSPVTHGKPTKRPAGLSKIDKCDGYDCARSNPSFSGATFVIPIGDYSSVLCVRVRPVELLRDDTVTVCGSSGKMHTRTIRTMNPTTTAKQTVAYVTTRRRDGHRTLWVCGSDGKIHEYRGKFPQCKHLRIPMLCKTLGIGRDYEVTLDRPKKNEFFGGLRDFVEYAGKAKPHAAKPRH